MSPSVRAGSWAGLLAGGVATAAITLGLFTGCLPVLALAMWERALRLIPMDIFAFFIVRLKFAAKPAAYWGVLASAALLWGILGTLLASRLGHLRRCAGRHDVWSGGAGPGGAPRVYRRSHLGGPGRRAGDRRRRPDLRARLHGPPRHVSQAHVRRDVTGAPRR